MTDGESKQMMTAMLEVKKCNTAEAMSQVCKLAQERYKFLRNKEANSVGWFVGQKVKLLPIYRHKRPYDDVGTVQKINPKKLIVLIDNVRWTIPKTMLESVM